MLPPAESLPVATTTTDVQLCAGGGVIVGWSFEETTAAAGAKFTLYDGTSTGGNQLSPITLLTNESTRDLIPGGGLLFETGLFLHVVSGSITGAIWAVLASRYNYRDLSSFISAVWHVY